MTKSVLWANMFFANYPFGRPLIMLIHQSVRPLFKIKDNNTKVVNDPLSQSHSLAGRFVCLILTNAYGQTDGWHVGQSTNQIFTVCRTVGLAEWIVYDPWHENKGHNLSPIFWAKVIGFRIWITRKLIDKFLRDMNRKRKMNISKKTLSVKRTEK